MAMVRSSEEDAIVAGLSDDRGGGSESKSKGWLVGVSFATRSTKTGATVSGAGLLGVTRMPTGGGGENVWEHLGHLTCFPTGTGLFSRSVAPHFGHLI
jgi:hypothetical protein